MSLHYFLCSEISAWKLSPKMAFGLALPTAYLGSCSVRIYFPPSWRNTYFLSAAVQGIWQQGGESVSHVFSFQLPYLPADQFHFSNFYLFISISFKNRHFL